MALLERVSTLLRANLNELVEKAEDPERLLKQIVLDMENQLMQVKTQVAIAIADEHLLEKKRAEHAEQAAEWRRKAELAVQKGHDDMARAALERALSHDQLVRVSPRRPRTRSTRPTICARPCTSWTRSSARLAPTARCWWPSIAAPRSWAGPRRPGRPSAPTRSTRWAG